MKSATPALLDLLNSGGDCEIADLWTLTLSGGVVVRWSGADVPLVDSSGNLFPLGPAITRGQISEGRGVDVKTLEMDIVASPDDQINGAPLIPFIVNRGLDGASVRLERAFLASWDTGVVGTMVRFAGRITSVGEISGMTAKITISSWLVLLNVNMPPNVYQTGCLHTLYDSGCKVNPAGFRASGVVGASPTQTSFSSNVGGVAGFYSQGRVVFTSGPNAGVSRTIKTSDGSGNFTLVQTLPAMPTQGDQFTVYAGCDLTMSTCRTKFNNLQHMKATPFVPVPETVA